MIKRNASAELFQLKFMHKLRGLLRGEGGRQKTNEK